MAKLLMHASAVILLVQSCFAVDPPHAVHGRISKIVADGKKVIVEAADGTAYTFRWIGETAAHGVKVGAVDAFLGLKEGAEVLVHYTGVGAEKVAVEIDRVAEDGFKVLKGTVSDLDRRAKVIVVKSANGADEAYQLTDRAAVESGQDLKKGAKVAVYYVTDGGKKVAHYFGMQ